MKRDYKVMKAGTGLSKQRVNIKGQHVRLKLKHQMNEAEHECKSVTLNYKVK